MNTKQETNNQYAGKNKKRETLFSFFIIFFLFLTFIGCQEPLTPNADIPAGKGSFSLALSDSGRTILPQTPDLNDFAVYNLSFTSTNGGPAESADRTNQTLGTTPILLDPGTYNLVVNAYKDSGKSQLLARGTLDGIVITAGQNTSKNVTLEALPSGGTGTFRWNITLPADMYSTRMTITPGSAGGTNQQTVSLFNQLSSNRTLNSGSYNLTFNLTKNNGEKTVVWKELLYVYQNLESSFIFTFTDAHFSNLAYTVTYNYNNGVTSNQTQSVLHGNTLSMPNAPTKGGYVFGGWYTDNDTFVSPWDFDAPVIKSFTLYAKWNYVSFEALTGLAEKLAWLQVHAQSNSSYLIEVSTDESIASHTLSYSDRSGITITLTGAGANRTVSLSLSSYGAMFTVASSITLILNNNITLQGRRNNSSLVRVNSGGTFTMSGGTISGNTSDGSDAGGVYVNGGTFAMGGGTISGNTASTTGSGYSGYGGGVYVNGGTFTMEGGTISNNTGGPESSGYGGGVYVKDGIFAMGGGTISGNTAKYGGGVSVNGGTFTMEGGTISGNTASTRGGGVHVNGTFTKDGGIITGYADDTANGNAVKSGVIIRDNNGHAVFAAYSYNNGSYIKMKETTAGEEVNLSYNIYGGVNPPTWSGAWDY